jgi:hypothetical protein
VSSEAAFFCSAAHHLEHTPYVAESDHQIPPHREGHIGGGGCHIGCVTLGCQIGCVTLGVLHWACYIGHVTLEFFSLDLKMNRVCKLDPPKAERSASQRGAVEQVLAAGRLAAGRLAADAAMPPRKKQKHESSRPNTRLAARAQIDATPVCFLCQERCTEAPAQLISMSCGNRGCDFLMHGECAREWVDHVHTEGATTVACPVCGGAALQGVASGVFNVSALRRKVVK